MKKLVIGFTLLVSLILVACGTTTTEEAPQPSDNEVVLGSSPQNATYIIENEPVTLVNGVAEKEIAPDSASKQVTRYFGNDVTLDLNGDGLMDTAFLLTQESGGSGVFFYVVAALTTAEGYQGTNGVFLGDRIAPQSTLVDPNNPAQFIVSYGDRATDEPMSAEPTQMVSKTFMYEADLLQEVVSAP
jgi:hypothetical protein